MWKPFLVVLLILTLPAEVTGQQQLNDSLKNVIATSKIDTTQMRAKWLLGKSYFRTGNPEFFDLFRSGLHQATEIKNSRWKQEFTGERRFVICFHSYLILKVL